MKTLKVTLGAILMACALFAFAGPKYNYKIVEVSKPKNADKVLAILNDMDSKGWEFMGSYGAEYLAYVSTNAKKSGEWARFIYRKPIQYDAYGVMIEEDEFDY